MPSYHLPRCLLYGELLNGQRIPGGPKLCYIDHICCILNKSNIPISDLEKLATDRDTWRRACTSGLSTLCQIKQLQIDVPAGTTSAAQQQLVPDVRSAAECVLPSLACAATFIATSHVLQNAASSTNFIVDVDGLLQAQASTSRTRLAFRIRYLLTYIQHL